MEWNYIICQDSGEGGRSACGGGEGAVGDVTWPLPPRSRIGCGRGRSGRGLAAADQRGLRRRESGPCVPRFPARAALRDRGRRRQVRRARGFAALGRRCESPGETHAAPRLPLRREAAEGPALPPVLLLYSPSCAAELIYRLGLAEWTNTKLLQVLPCKALGHSEGFRGQDKLLLRRARQYCRGRTVVLGCVLERKDSHGAWCFELPLLCAYTICRTQVNLYATYSKDHLFEVFLYFSQFF